MHCLVSAKCGSVQFGNISLLWTHPAKAKCSRSPVLHSHTKTFCISHKLCCCVAFREFCIRQQPSTQSIPILYYFLKNHTIKNLSLDHSYFIKASPVNLFSLEPRETVTHKVSGNIRTWRNCKNVGMTFLIKQLSDI